MKYHSNGKILLSTAAAVVTLALGASIVLAPASPPQKATAAPSKPYPAVTLSAMAFDSASNGNPAPRQTSQAMSKAAPSGSTPLMSLEIEAEGRVTVGADRATGGASMARVDSDGDLFPQGRSLPPVEKVSAFLERHGAVFGISDADSELRVIGMKEDQYGFSRVTYQQMHGDVPVFGAVMHGHVAKDGRLTAVNGKFIPDVNLPQNPVIGRADASMTATSVVSNQLPSRLKDVDLTAASTGLYVYREFLTRGTPGENHLAYEVEVTHGNDIREFVYVDAVTGKVVDQITGIQGSHAAGKHRTIYQSNKDDNNLLVVWDEATLNARPAADPSVEDQVSGAGYSYNLFLNLSGGEYRSWDGENADMLTVNTDPTIVCPNANWNGTSTNYCVGTTSDDVVAHEWGHAYTQETSGLIYAWQSGALNESYSDIWGETVDLLNNREGVTGPKGTAAAPGNDGPRSQDENVCSDYNSESNPGTDPSYRWLMGEDAAAFAALPPAGDSSIRDMWNPRCASGEVFLGSDPGHVTSGYYHCSESDGGGVHTNSSINNRAYAMLVDGNTLELKDDGTPFANPVTVNGIGLTKAAHIFWRANSQYNTPASNFSDNADALEMACADLVGVNLTKLITSAEDGTSPVLSQPGANDDTVDPPIELSGEIITAADCGEVANAIAAVEMRADVTKQCNFSPMLSQAPAPMCGNAEVISKYSEDFESGFFNNGWSTGGTSVNPATKSTANWVASNTLPKNPDGSLRTTTAAFQENVRGYGNCADDDESGNQWLESPKIELDSGSSQFLMFEHYFHSEISYDGGNVMYSTDDGATWDVIPASAFVHNPYNGALESAVSDAPNTGPKEGQEAWHGSNQGEIGGDWGQSQIDLTALDDVGPGATIKLRWDFGQDGCNGSDEGWYVDSMEVFSCGEDLTPPTERCNVYPAGGFLPVVGSPIVSLFGSTTTATVSGEDDPITDVNILNLTGSHTYMGDLTFELESPAGTSITLFDGASCGSEDGIDVDFDDAADAVIGCGSWQSGGTFRPIEALTTFDGENANGDWTLNVFDAFPQDEGQIDSWAVEFCTPIDPEDNLPPVAIDDTATTEKNTSTVIDVLTNDSDPENGPLNVVSATDPVNGSVVINMDNTITYVPDQNYIGTDNFLYTIADDEGEEDTAAVSVTVNDTNSEADIDKTTGGGWMASNDGGKINFGFNAKQKDSGPQGNLQLSDKTAGVKIHLKDVTLVQAASNTCSQINSNANSLEFHGAGTFNKANASFRVCVEDNGEPGNSSSAAVPDRFFLECVDGCNYSTANRVSDNELDGGNIQVQRAASPSPESGTSSSSESGSANAQASTVILDPVLLTEGTLGALQPFAIKVYGPQQEPLGGQYVNLKRLGADGSVESFTGITGPAGTALITIAISGQPSDLGASVGGVDSNRVEITPVLP